LRAASVIVFRWFTCGRYTNIIVLRALRAAGETQADVDARTLAAIVAFLREHL
jgi:hypothetical protein